MPKIDPSKLDNPIAYDRNDTIHVRDAKGIHAYLQSHYSSGTASLKPIKSVDRDWLYGRPIKQHYPITRDGASHFVANMIMGHGGWSWYHPLPLLAKAAAYLPEIGSSVVCIKKVRNGHDLFGTWKEYDRLPPEKLNSLMTQAECNKGLSADDYAKTKGKLTWLTGGETGTFHEWCHLISHGLGGQDEEKNIVAATCHQNTEQLVLESVLYGYWYEGFTVNVHANLALGWRHLAESIYYEVRLGPELVFKHTMDCRRVTHVSKLEVAQLGRKLRLALNAALEKDRQCRELTADELILLNRNGEEAPDPLDLVLSICGQG